MGCVHLRRRLSEYGINVYEVAAWNHQTDMTSAVQEIRPLDRRRMIPQGRWGLPEDIGKAVVALVSVVLNTRQAR